MKDQTGRTISQKTQKAKKETVKWENTLSSLKSRKKIRRKTSLDDVPAQDISVGYQKNVNTF